MATLGIDALTFPDEEEARIIAALKTYWLTHDAAGVEIKPKREDIKLMLHGMLAAQVRDIVYRVECADATQRALAGITQTNIT